MEWAISAHAALAPWRRRLAWQGAVVALTLGLAAPQPMAASLSDRQLQVIGRAAAFLQPVPPGTAVAVVYDPARPDSRQDADQIAAAIGSGLAVADRLLPARVVTPDQLADGNFALVLAAAGVNGEALAAGLRTAHRLCVTTDLAMVQAGFCTMAVTTDVRVQIVLNHAAAAADGINFAPAFRMMIREI